MFEELMHLCLNFRHVLFLALAIECGLHEPNVHEGNRDIVLYSTSGFTVLCSTRHES